MEKSILDPSKHTAYSSKFLHPPHMHLLPLLIASVVIGILFMANSQTQTLAQSIQTPPIPTYSPASTENLAYADTIGETPIHIDNPIEQSDQQLPIAESLPISSPSASLNADTIFSMVNSIRQQNGLTPFTKNDQLCSLATSRAPEVTNEIATGTMHHGMYARNLPYWNNENIVSFNSESAAVDFWMSDSVHRDAILGNTQYSCIACSGNACAEEFSNFEPK